MDLQTISRFELRQQITLMINRYEYWVSGTDGAEAMVAFVEQKRLKLKEEITAYTSKTRETVLFELRAQKVIDLSGRYHVYDADGQLLGYLRKVFRRSLWRSTWEVYDAEDKLLFRAQESNPTLALVRRIGGEIPFLELVIAFIPYHFDLLDGTKRMGTHRRHIGLRDHYDLVLEPDASAIDRRLVLAFGIVLDALQSR